MTSAVAPNAPVRHTVRLSAVITAGDEVLVVRRPDGTWDLPGGPFPLGRSIPDAIRDLVAADTGALVAVQGVTGIYPRHTPRLGIVCRATHISGQIAPAQSHTVAAIWVRLPDLPAYLTAHSVVQIHDALLPQKMWPELARPPGGSSAATTNSSGARS